jgi:tape measure domain-containing protein
MDVFALTLRLKEEGAASVRAATMRLGVAAKRSASDLKQMDSATQALSSSMRSLAASLGAAVGGRALAQAADSYTQITNQLRLATGSSNELAVAQARVFAIAQQTAQPFAAVADLYARTGRAAAALGLSQAEVARVTAFVNQAITLSGSSAASASGAITQLGQALAAGTLRAEEFNSIQDGAPALISAVEKELGLQVGGLRKLAMEGKLSSQQFVQAMLANTSVAKEFGTTTRTMGQTLTTVQNVFVQMVGKLNDTYGISLLVNKALTALATNLGTVTALVLSGTVAWVSYSAAIRSAVVLQGLLTASGTIAAFVSLAKTVRSLADAAALVSMASGGWTKLIATVVAGAGALVAYKLVAKQLADATAAANVELETLAGTVTSGVTPALTTATADVVDQVAALMRLVEITDVTRVEAGILAREERRLQTELAKTNLAYDARLALVERLLAVQAAQAAMTVRLTAEERALGLGALPSMGLTPGGSRPLPQIRPHHKNGQLVSGGTPTDMLATGFAALEGDAEKVQQRLAASLDTTKLQMADQMDAMKVASMVFANDIANTLVDSLAAGIETAIATGSLGEGFKALTRTLLSGLGSALQSFGRAAILGGTLMKKFMDAMGTLNPFVAVAAGIGMVALGSMLKGAAQRSFGGGGGSSTMGGGIGSLGVGGSSVTRTFGPTMSGSTGASVQAATPMQVTIIGPNDPNAQRAIATLMDNAARRGLVQGAGVRTL